MTTTFHLRPAVGTLRRAGLLLTALLCTTAAFAQTVGETLDNYTDYSRYTIAHKSKTKWHDIRDNNNLSATARSTDSFNDDVKTFDMQTIAGRKIQAAHTYIDTIYVHKGSTTELYLPTYMSKGSTRLSNYNYIRWYSYRTDGTFRLQNRNRGDRYDLLTPTVHSMQRFENGYVEGLCVGIKPYGQTMKFYYPTDNEFNRWFPDAGTDVDNNWFIVACDISPYNDFADDYKSGGTTFGTRNNYCEPTLSDRILFYIVAVDDRDDDNFNNGYGRLKQSAYQGGTSTGSYLEEYDITFPSHHVSNHTDELVSLSKDARSYAIPGVSSSNDNSTTLNVSITSDNNALQLVNTTVSNEKRVIQFRKRNANTHTAWNVPDGTTATILVTKRIGRTTYNIARYNLTFRDEASPLTQSQVAALDNPDGIANGKWYKALTYRSPTYMNANMNLLTSLTFDYEEEIGDSYGQPKFYPYPMDWNNSSYAFYDGAERTDFPGDRNDNGYISGYTSLDYPEYGSYSLVKDYVGYGDLYNLARPTEGLAKDKGTFYLYVDASDRPGVVARLPFKEKLCQGSELFVTAWVKSAGTNNETSDDAGLLFTLMGVSTDAQGNTTYTPIYRQSSGQIRTTTYITGGEPGTGSGTNEWFQVYFSFMNKGNVDYDSYVVQVDNNCASTNGGDFYFDEFKVFVVQPTAVVRQLEATCTSERTLMNMDFDYERLMSRLGHAVDATYTEDDIDGVDFCFIDELKYNEYLAEHPGEVAKAIDYALVPVGQDDNLLDYPTLRFHLDFDANTAYDKNATNLASGNMHPVTGASQPRAFFYQHTDEGGVKQLSVDFYSLLSPNRPYLLLLKPLIKETEYASAEEFAATIDDPCGIQTRFYVTSQTLLKVNGEVIDPSVDFCAGQIFNFSTQVRVPTVDPETNEESYITIDEGVYFDWFFGTETEYLAPNEAYNGATLQQALEGFRALYPDAEEMDGTTVPDADGVFTQDEHDLLAWYLAQNGTAGGLNARLVLHRSTLDIRLLDTGLDLVVQPIHTLVPPGTIDDELWGNICWSYIPLQLRTSGRAPSLNVGFDNLEYPSTEHVPALRIGRSQIETATTTANALVVKLSRAEYATEGVDRIGRAADDTYRKLYLVASDDPAYRDLLGAPDFDQYSLPIGTIATLQAKEYADAPTFDNSMTFYFDLSEQTVGQGTFRFNPKEGYTYTFTVHFEEKKADGTETVNTCQGSFPLEMKVVPEYLIWRGGRTDNWNNDENWERADADELHRTGYTTNTANTTSNGFVPLPLSKVVLPADSRTELYMAGYENGTHWETTRPDYMEQPTTDIQYDLVVDNVDGHLTTVRYRVNQCNQIHLEPGAQLLHPEMLLYQTARTDVVVPNNTWQLVATPLQGVVAGDWYTATSGSQASEPYFEDRTFNAATDSRLNPAVFQRSWAADASIVESSATTTAPNYAQTRWTSAYNDAAVPYQAGMGFSVKAHHASADELLFRFPKADAAYDVATGTPDRTGAGRFIASQLADRSNPFSYQPADHITVNPAASADGYVLVGNPFTAPLSMREFMAANTQLTGSFWLETDKGPVAGSATVTDGWDALSSDGTDDVLVGPNRAFFVQLKERATGLTAKYPTIKFTAAMQQMADIEPHPSTTAFAITAANEQGCSSAAIAYADGAADNYVPGEDTQLLVDPSATPGTVPLVYTIAGDKAVSLNRLAGLMVVPLGLYGADGQTTYLTFTGVDALLDPVLYDAETGRSTVLTEGYRIAVDGPSHGRYFLRTSGPAATGIGSPAAGTLPDVSVYSPVAGQLVVSASAALSRIEVYTTAGVRLLTETPAPGQLTHTFTGVASGVAVVRVGTDSGVAVRKVSVR